MASNWAATGLTLACVLIFASGIAWLARYIAENKLEGQTFALVCVGVTGVLVISGPLVGWEAVTLVLLAFVVAAVPMAVEYYGRVLREHRKALAEMQKAIDDRPQEGGEEE